MEAAALGAEVFSTLKSVGFASMVLALCFLGLAAWLSREAFRTGRSLRIKVTPRSLDITIDPDNSRKSDPQPEKEGNLLRVAETESNEERVGRTRSGGSLRRRLWPLAPKTRAPRTDGVNGKANRRR